MKKLSLILSVLVGFVAFAAEVIPPAPKQYFNDYAGVISRNVAAQLNQRLEQFERDSSSQILVAVFPKMQSDSSIEDYTVRVAQAWKAGQKGKDNGAVLFVFTQDRKMYLQVGYGLEGVLPDAICKRIIADEITPHFREGNLDAGLTAGVNAILAAAKGEYKGTGRTVAERFGGKPVLVVLAILVVFLVLLAMIRAMRRAGGTTYHSRGRSSWGAWTIASGSSGGWGGGGWSGGGGGGGGFSGGGGSFGGGGAGGSW